MRVAIYARVSTEDKGQDPENQLRDLRAWCTNSGHDIVGEYIDRVSGRKGTGERKQFAALFEDASRRKFDCVLFWALDRFSREGMVPTIHHLERLNSYGVTFHSYTEPHLCADNEMVRGILLAVLATMAKQEAKRLSERVIAGMRKAAAKGTKSGKPIGRGSTPRRKGRSSDFCGVARALTRRLRPSASGLPPFSGSGLKWALSKARPRREAAKDETARAVARRVAGRSCARSRLPTTSIIRRSVGSTRATPRSLIEPGTNPCVSGRVRGRL